MRNRSAVSRVVACAILLMLVGATAVTASAPNFSLRPGTIGHALLQPDGTHVHLDAEVVSKIRFRQNPNYFTVKEFFSGRYTLVVSCPAPPELRHGQIIDVEGTITTLWNGERAITNPTIYAYLDEDGSILYHGPLLKGLTQPTPWNWKRVLSSPFASASLTDFSAITLSDGGGESGEPNTLLSAPTYCVTIAEARAQYSPTERVLVELQCRPLENPVSGHFTMKEDGSSDTITVYYTKSVQATDRINKIVGAIQKDAGSNYWLEVNSGPNWLPQDVKGSVQKAASGTIPWLKTLPDETVLEATVEDKVVSRVFPAQGYCYIQERQDESLHVPSGIRLYYSGELISGDIVSVETDQFTTRVTTVDGERAIADPSYVTVTTSVAAPDPIVTNHLALGGGPLNIFTPGPTGGVRVNNVGLLVRSFGRVTSVAPEYFYLDDGYRASDGSQTDNAPNVGVRVVGYASSDYMPAIGDNLQVTGISGLATYATDYARTIRVAESTDVVVVRPVGPPPSFEAHATGSGKITCYWRGVPGATGYNVYRGTVSGGQDYQHPVNGSTPWNTQSYAGSNVFAFSDTGLANGTMYFYTVKAVRGYGESAASNEDSDAPDPDAIPWGTRDPWAITNAVQAWAGVYADLVRAVGPDGTTYCNWYGVILPEGAFEPGTNVLHFPNGADVPVPDDGGELVPPETGDMMEAFLVDAPLEPSDGPYRRVRSDPGYTGSYGVFRPGWLNQIQFGWGAWKDTYYTYLGHHKEWTDGAGKPNVSDVDAGLQWSRVYEMYNPFISLKSRRRDSLPIYRGTPVNSPIRFDTSYFGDIQMCYALQIGGMYSIKYLPTLLVSGWDEWFEQRTVILAAASGISSPTAQMKRCHSIAQGKPPIRWQATGSNFWGAEFYAGELRTGSGQWVTWTGDRTAQQGSYPARGSRVNWSIPFGKEYYEETDIEINCQ